MEQHVKTLAILNIVYAGLGILIAVGILLFFGGLAGIASHDAEPDAAAGAAVLGAIGGIAFIAIAIFSVPTLIAGIGLLSFREWARILTIVMSAIHLLNIPFGTALGIYGIWALTKDEMRDLFKSRNLRPQVATAR